MKYITLTLLALCTTVVFAQQKTISQATITTKTTIVSLEEDDYTVAPPPPSAEGAEVRIMRFGGDGETKSITQIKNNLVKSVINNEINITTTI